ncbi:hypothetical protein AVEN_103160-1 [Araneus ventricosus]|uniref:Uncharacterized protein n=1 Tax=Araneus ventricosus TaxID=182803 RepID=A0A4Y2JW74_ARAVE|nr:hypothetical protein AVEN_51607-1 [Araneus ventricosus]GBN18319.1 hypothetical protein AVEN_103160-1 [Araneus ventricosus]
MKDPPIFNIICDKRADKCEIGEPHVNRGLKYGAIFRYVANVLVAGGYELHKFTTPTVVGVIAPVTSALRSDTPLRIATRNQNKGVTDVEMYEARNTAAGGHIALIVQSNKKFRTNYRTEHSCLDPNCKSLNKQKDLIRQRADYGN